VTVTGRSYPTLVLVLVLCAVATSVAADDATPDWAQDLALFALGGPPAGVLVISLNGEFAAQIGAGSPPRLDVADLLHAGTNEMELEFRPDATITGRRLKLRIGKAERVSSYQNVIKRAMIAVDIPAETPPSTCKEKIRFWAGPPASPPVELEKRYWLVTAGPPVNQRVTVLINDAPVYQVSSGGAFVEITEHTRKGKNEVTFELAPTCFAQPSSSDEMLRLLITTGSPDHFDSPPLASLSVPKKRNPKPTTRAQAYRGK